jgi:hypothetical protein
MLVLLLTDYFIRIVVMDPMTSITRGGDETECRMDTFSKEHVPILKDGFEVGKRSKDTRTSQGNHLFVIASTAGRSS